MRVLHTKSGRAGIQLIVLFFLLVSGAAASPFSVPSGSPQMNLTTSRLVVLDDPSGWVNGWGANAAKGNRVLEEETTIRWYALVINSSGRAAAGISVTAQLRLPNGTLHYSGTQNTDSNGYANFFVDLDNMNQRPYNASSTEGYWSINASAVVDSHALDSGAAFIYDEFGCGKSGPACHRSQDWQPSGISIKNFSLWRGGGKNSPYVQSNDRFHGTSGHGNLAPDPQILGGECMTCHKSYNGTYINFSARQDYEPQYPGGAHDNKIGANCTDCHGIYDTANGVSDMPVKRCYDGGCHSELNNNLSNLNYTQNDTMGYSYMPLNTTNTVRSHTLQIDIPCIICHGSSHNVSKPYNAAGTSNSMTEYQQCIACHGAYQRHNNSVNCTVCHSQDAHVIKVFAQDATYMNGSTSSLRGNCTGCHQNSTFMNALLSSTYAGSYSGSAPQIPAPLKHGDDANAGEKWNQTPGYWTRAVQSTSCIYCHGKTMHNVSALGRPSLFGGAGIVNSIIATDTYWCSSCHVQGYSSGTKTYTDMTGVFNFPDEPLPVPPEITGNASFGADQSNPSYSNHSSVSKDDSSCGNCHGGTGGGITGFMHNVSLGENGGPNCKSCHDTGGTAGEGRLVNFSTANESIHSDLNSNVDTVLPAENRKCWACHGNGSEPGDGHPSNYKTPKNCNNNDCHSLAQSQFNETMVYSHFRNASLNSNPYNAINYNVTAAAQCQICHMNSLAREETGFGLALVSHYGSKNNLIDSFNCRYCHLNKDNSRDWGNATLVNKNRTSSIEIEKEKDKFTVRENGTLYLGEGYALKVVEISEKRDEALIQLLRGDDIADEVLLGIGTPYMYEKETTIDNATFKTLFITLNITSIFKGGTTGFIQFNGTRLRKIHRESENNSACYACHLYSYSRERFQVLDKEGREDSPDIIYLARVLVDFKPENKSKVYFNDEDYIFSKLEGGGEYFSYPSKQKYLKEGEAWNIADNYSVKLREVSTDSKKAFLSLMIDNRVVMDDTVDSGQEFRYAPAIRYNDYAERNVTVFTARVASVAQGSPNFVILKDVVAVSPGIVRVTANATFFGYNSSWFNLNDTLVVGKIPANLHSPNLFTDLGAWGDCVRCHDSSERLGIAVLDAISSRLGKHAGLNKDAYSSALLSDPIDKACWACHSEGEEPMVHSPTYIEPRNCSSCHVHSNEPSYSAINISDEPHGSETGCEKCHISGSHTLIRFEVSPVIRDAALSRTSITQGGNINLTARANAGYRMRIRAAEYFLDRTGVPGSGIPLRPLDGTFDSQREEVAADINTTGIQIGGHLLYVHAMERADRWGEFYQVRFTVTLDHGTIITAAGRDPAFLSILTLITALVVSYLIALRFKG